MSFMSHYSDALSP